MFQKTERFTYNEPKYAQIFASALELVAQPETATSVSLTAVGLSMSDRIDSENAEQRKSFEALSQRLDQYKIYSTLPFTETKYFYDHVETAQSGNGWLTRTFERLGVGDPVIIWRLLTNTYRQDLVLLSGGDRGDLIYLALAGLIPFIKTPHVLVDAHWQPEGGLLNKLQRLLLRLGRRLLIQVQPHTAEESKIQEEYFGIPQALSHPIPWSSSLIGFEIDPADGDYIVTGGVSFRDYKTFFTAVRDLPYPIEIGANPTAMGADAAVDFSGVSDQDRSSVIIHRDLDNQGYYQKVARSKVFVMPLVPGLLRSAGDQTILNSMYFGKVVIATDSIATRAYIRNGVNGFIVPPSDPAAMRAAIEAVYNLSDAEYREIADQAEYDAKVTFGEERRVYRTATAALDALTEQH